jgi:16S rRNA (uracil1498-N3)-methyltransferase
MSRPPRFFIAPSQVSGSRISISDEDVRHIAAVLRMKTGDSLLLCDGHGVEYQVAIAEISKSEIKTDIINQSKREITAPRITLGQGLPKSDKMDWIVQKATELGVSNIVPLVTERTIVKIRDEEKRISRWQKIAREAAMQSNRPDIPQVEQVRPFRDFIFSLDPGSQSLPPGSSAPELRTLKLIPWEEASAPIKDVLKQNAGAHHIIVLIGPEGGFSSNEASMALEKGFHAVSLGPNILRTETAAIAVLSMIGYECSGG